MSFDSRLAEDVMYASAFCLCDGWPELVDLTPAERLDSIVAYFEAAFMAYRDGLAGWVPEPSAN
ncbi:hypothetical protein J8F10_03500 [Gemmata sp. G18]|uniref:Uncharacterized protein n=1 Tax=Gemmata palustris TaxID=2822762 RepID=A0ABS5BKX3_9BACT|nr:hypothetical protein [Gemmata palustris]MBP3954362.1 hypothetical protein [Gemmata palustris]